MIFSPHINSMKLYLQRLQSYLGVVNLGLCFSVDALTTRLYCLSQLDFKNYVFSGSDWIFSCATPGHKSESKTMRVEQRLRKRKPTKLKNSTTQRAGNKRKGKEEELLHRSLCGLKRWMMMCMYPEPPPPFFFLLKLPHHCSSLGTHTQNQHGTGQASLMLWGHGSSFWRWPMPAFSTPMKYRKRWLGLQNAANGNEDCGGDGWRR